MAKTIIRVPRTTAMFVTGLGRILREHLSLSITEHEHWTFEHVGEWSECGSKGRCVDHGVSDKAYAEFVEQEGLDPWRDYDRHYSHFRPCYPYEMNVYLGTGQARVRGRKVQLRVRIEETHSDVMGDLFIARVWVRDEKGDITRGEFGLHDDGRPYPTDKPVPDQPPRRLAFWHQAEETVSLPA